MSEKRQCRSLDKKYILALSQAQELRDHGKRFRKGNASLKLLHFRFSIPSGRRRQKDEGYGSIALPGGIRNFWYTILAKVDMALSEAQNPEAMTTVEGRILTMLRENQKELKTIRELLEGQGARDAEEERDNVDPNGYRQYRSTVPDPRGTRSSKKTSFVGVAQALKTAVVGINEKRREEGKPLLQEVSQTSLSFSREIMSRAETLVSSSTVFGQHVGRLTFTEIRNVYANDREKFQNAFSNVMKRLTKSFPILDLARGGWAADEIVRQKLISMKDATKKSTKDVGNEGAPRDATKITKKAAGNNNAGSDDESPYETEEDIENDEKELCNVSEYIFGEKCALHFGNVECEICEWRDVDAIPQVYLKARLLTKKDFVLHSSSQPKARDENRDKARGVSKMRIKKERNSK